MSDRAITIFLIGLSLAAAALIYHVADARDDVRRLCVPPASVRAHYEAAAVVAVEVEPDRPDLLAAVARHVDAADRYLVSATERRVVAFVGGCGRDVDLSEERMRRLIGDLQSAALGRLK